MQRKLTKLLLLLFSTCLFCCTQNKVADKNIFEKSPKEELDSYCAYLEDSENYNDSTYLAFFYERFNQLVAEKKIDSAAQVLAITSLTLDSNYKTDTAFLQTSKRFMSKFDKQIADRYYSGIYSNIGNTYYNSSKFDSAILYLNKAIIKAKDHETLQNNANSTYSLLYCYLGNGKLEQSLKAGFKSVQLFESLKDTAFQGAAYSGIANIYRYQEDYAESEKYENKGFELLKKTTDTSTILVVMQNRLTLYDEIHHENLLPLIDSLVTLYQSWSEKSIVEKFSVNSWYAVKLIAENKLVKAKAVLDEIKPLFSKVDDEVSRENYFVALSEYEIKVGKGSKNVAFYLKRIAELEENKNYLSLELYNQILHDDAVLKKDYKSALKYIEQVQIANDSLSNKALRIKVKELDKKHQTDKKIQQIALQKIEIEKKNNFITLLLVSLIGLLSVIYIYYLWQKQKKLKQEKTNSMNFTKQLLENTEDERKRIASDLHDSISHELLNLKSIFKQDLTTVNAKIDSIINDIRGISRNLHPVMFDKIGLVPNIEQLVERMQIQNNFLVSTEIDYEGTLSSADELQIYRIIQEALTNIIKYSEAHAAKITILEGNSKIDIEIKDNGKGFNVKETLNGGKAFGLHNIIERSRVIGGEVHIQSSSEGTIININIPKKP